MTGQTNDNPAGGPPRQDEPKDKQKAARSLRRSLAVRLISASLLATLLLGGIVFYETRSLLTTAVETQLGSQQGSQARAISTGLSSIKDTVSVMARDQELVRALSDLAAAFEELDQQSDLLEPEEVESLDKLYRDMVAEAAARTGFDLPPSEELVPAGEAGRYLQYHYIVANPFPSGETDQLVMAEGDDSGYGAVHEQHHEVVNWKRSNFGFSDLMLLNTNGDVVYTSMKQTDLGRNLISSLFVGDALGSAIVARLTGVALGETILIDFQRYAPAGGAPTMFAAAAVSSDQGAIGAVVVTVPIEALNGLTTSQERWKDVGLGDTGEAYVVGRDLLMRSDSRLWLEDQDAYLATLNDQDYPPGTASEFTGCCSTVVPKMSIDSAVPG
ncbi:MAG: hypothetical protein U9N84_14355, partial [Actinomycetota bacterium]|nr:hypothetical protein [Actinomycetota bacterium]